MARIALYTFGILKGAYQSEALTEFAGMARMIFPTLGGADGFIAQAGDARPDLLGRAGHGEDFGAWGVYVAPRFFDARWQASGASMVQTLSLWRDCEAARRFAYNGLHRDALKRRSAWFQPPQWPGYVLWWVPEDVVPLGRTASDVWKSWPMRDRRHPVSASRDATMNPVAPSSRSRPRTDGGSPGWYPATST
ncbi:hypothetical protein QO001_002769 [Methylobacterium brachiatum]|jgi:hypothetical protein|uniref:DUF3291 domain-containing protein n=1 Tax=Methylobacterium brachiatum TaxID=269660 RepID=A0AAJ1WX44_9HYPH|nr:DUF3291 domain-containing protein [Methylobacterium brachiatum]MCB4803120.1 DUF3291 domain-containing protein [Methylobacterium brachiatum]MDQ0543840.1 hypothetical protein [Methylobacterium brachiatum]